MAKRARDEAPCADILLPADAWGCVMPYLSSAERATMGTLSKDLREIYLTHCVKVRMLIFDDKKEISSLRPGFLKHIRSVQVGDAATFDALMRQGAPIEYVWFNCNYSPSRIPPGIIFAEFMHKVGRRKNDLFITAPDLKYLVLRRGANCPICVRSPIAHARLCGKYAGAVTFESQVLTSLAIDVSYPSEWIPESVSSITYSTDTVEGCRIPPFVKHVIFEGDVLGNVHFSNVTHATFRGHVHPMVDLAGPYYLSFMTLEYIHLVPPTVTHLTIVRILAELIPVPPWITHMRLMASVFDGAVRIVGGRSLTHLWLDQEFRCPLKAAPRAIERLLCSQEWVLQAKPKCSCRLPKEIEAMH